MAMEVQKIQKLQIVHIITILDDNSYTLTQQGCATLDVGVVQDKEQEVCTRING